MRVPQAIGTASLRMVNARDLFQPIMINGLHALLQFSHGQCTTCGRCVLVSLVMLDPFRRGFINFEECETIRFETPRGLMKIWPVDLNLLLSHEHPPIYEKYVVKTSIAA